MQHITELQHRWWYRLIKVLYFSAIVVILALGLLSIFSTQSDSLDLAQTTLDCDNGVSIPLSELPLGGTPTTYDLGGLGTEGTPKKIATFGQLTDKGFTIYISPNYNLDSSPWYSGLQTECSQFLVTSKDGTSKLVPYDQSKNMSLDSVQSINGLTYEDSGGPLIWAQFETGDRQDAQTNFHLTLVPKSIVWEQISYSVELILGVLIFFEFIRRIFYYVVLGKVRPR